MKNQHLLKAYRAGLQLYPADFYKAYGSQMLMIAEETLREAPTWRAVAKVAGELVVDLLVTVVKENGKHTGGRIMKRAKKMSRTPKQKALVWSLQIVGVGILSYFWLAYATTSINAMRHVNGESFFGSYFWTWLAQVGAVSVPLLFIPLAFVVLRKAANMSVWRKLGWSYGIGLAGTIGYLLIARIANDLSLYYTSQHHDYDWLLGLLFMIGYYLVLQRFQTRIRFAKK